MILLFSNYLSAAFFRLSEPRLKSLYILAFSFDMNFLTQRKTPIWDFCTCKSIEIEFQIKYQAFFSPSQPIIDPRISKLVSFHEPRAASLSTLFPLLPSYFSS